MDDARLSNGHTILGMKQLRDIMAFVETSRASGPEGETNSTLPQYASKYAVLHLTAAGPKVQTMLDTGVDEVCPHINK